MASRKKSKHSKSRRHHKKHHRITGGSAVKQCRRLLKKAGEHSSGPGLSACVQRVKKLISLRKCKKVMVRAEKLRAQASRIEAKAGCAR